MRTELWALLAFVVLVAGCGQSPGSPCQAMRCPADQLCVPLDATDPLRGGICMATCERRSQCPNGQICRPLHYAVGSVCDLGGDERLGLEARCDASEASDPCAEGLICRYPRCVPQCAPTSPHSEDRVCPTGWLCNLRQNAGDCQQRCEPSDPESCGGYKCVRFSHPTEGTIGLCEFAGAYIDCGGTTCGDREVCVDGTCVSTADAPPLEYEIAPDVPDLVD